MSQPEEIQLTQNCNSLTTEINLDEPDSGCNESIIESESDYESVQGFLAEKLEEVEESLPICSWRNREPKTIWEPPVINKTKPGCRLAKYQGSSKSTASKATTKLKLTPKML